MNAPKRRASKPAAPALHESSGGAEVFALRGFPAVALTVLTAVFGAAGTASSACAPDSAVVIYYGNGMYISPARARVQSLLMDRKIRPALPAGTNVSFSYSYNNSEDEVTQVLQVLGQALDDKSVKFQSWLNVPSSAPSVFRNAINTAEQSARVGSYVKDADLGAHVARYQTDLAAGKRVIVLAHSQGNFYANRAYEELSSTAGFGIVSVGTPAGFTAGSGPHTSLTNDKVIDPIPGRRPLNTTNSPSFVSAARDADGHSFTRSYLNGDVSGPKIIGQVKDMLAALPCPATP
jgi:hypothetical protein